jgi:hypothetical protein
MDANGILQLAMFKALATIGTLSATLAQVAHSVDRMHSGPESAIALQILYD